MTPHTDLNSLARALGVPSGSLRIHGVHPEMSAAQARDAVAADIKRLDKVAKRLAGRVVLGVKLTGDNAILRRRLARLSSSPVASVAPRTAPRMTAASPAPRTAVAGFAPSRAALPNNADDIPADVRARILAHRFPKK